MGKGAVYSSPTLPPELQELTKKTADMLLRNQPFSEQIAGQMQAHPEWYNLQTAPLTDLEQNVVGSAGQLAPWLTASKPGFATAADALSLNAPTTQLALSPVNTMTQRLQDYYDILGESADLASRPVEPSNNLFDATAANLTAGLPIARRGLGTPDAENEAMRIWSSVFGGDTVGSAPSTRQAMEAMEKQYETRSLPSLQNQLAIAGLGRSGALSQGIADLRGQMAEATVPLLQQEIDTRLKGASAMSELGRIQTAREEAPLTRELQYLTSMTPIMERMGEFRSELGQKPAERKLQLYEGVLPQLAGLHQGEQQQDRQRIQQVLEAATGTAAAGTQQNQALLETMKTLAQAGSLPREVLQSGLQAMYEGGLRQQALSEQYLFSPLGILPSTIGSKASGGGGGLFGS